MGSKADEEVDDEVDDEIDDETDEQRDTTVCLNQVLKNLLNKKNQQGKGLKI